MKIEIFRVRIADLLQPDFETVYSPSRLFVYKDDYDAMLKSRDNYARAMALALREGIFPDKSTIKQKIEHLLAAEMESAK